MFVSGSTFRRFALCLSLALSVAVYAQNGRDQNLFSAQQLTNTLIAGSQADMQAVAQHRRNLLLNMARTSPQEVLRLMLPSEVVNKLPASVRPLVESDADEQGTLEVQVEDYPDYTHRTLYFLNTPKERLQLFFGEKPPKHLLSGTRVRARGKRLDGALMLTSGATPTNTSTAALQTLALASPNTFGAQSTLVLLVNFSDNMAQPTTVEAAQNLVFTQVSNFDKENSQNQTWLTGDVFGWFTLPMNSTTCDTNTLASQAKQAATNAGITLSNYKRYVYLFPTISACGWSGLGSIGGSPSQAWINGYVSSLQVIGHEMGHNFGLYHAHSQICNGSTLGANCSTGEYGDVFDIMGNYTASHFSAFAKERLGWLNYGSSLPITTASASGTYTLQPYENGSGSKALKILKSTDSSTGANTYYYVEYRQPVGFDSILSSYPAATSGVIIRTGSPSTSDSSFLLDINPATPSFKDAPLPVGGTFIDSAAGVSINLASANASGATLNVTLGTSSCTHNNPNVAITPAASANAGTAVNYTVSVANNDSSVCGSGNFNLAVVVPSNWSGSFASSMLALAPGGSGSTTLRVTSLSSAGAALYNFSVSATNAAATSSIGSATGSYTVTGTTATPVPAGITVVSPTIGSTVNSPVQFSATAASSTTYAITAMRIYVDNVSRYTVNAATISTALTLTAGMHNVVFVAWDASGQAYTKALTINVAGTTTSGNVTIISPKNGSTVTSPVQFVATATASTGRSITAMRVYVDNVSAYTVSGASLNASLTMSRGSHYVVVQAWDNTGAVYRTSETITAN